MKKILFIEDEGELADKIKERLYNYSIEKVYSYSTATGAWSKCEREFNCIILDLNISADKLEDEALKKEYHGIHGILVLKAFCENKTPEKQEEIWKKTVIYSAFTDELEGKEIIENAPCKPEIIPKEIPNSISVLIKAVERIVNQKFDYE